MPIKLVPCDECDFWRQQFEADGRTVLGCEPADPGLCALRWELRAATGAAPPPPAAKKAARPAPRARGTRRSR